MSSQTSVVYQFYHIEASLNQEYKDLRCIFKVKEVDYSTPVIPSATSNP